MTTSVYSANCLLSLLLIPLQASAVGAYTMSSRGETECREANMLFDVSDFQK